MKKILENINQRTKNHIFPFFWQHGEDKETIKLYIEKIQESSIGAICIEARPHPAFLEQKWWDDLDIILEEAKKRNMKIWILDDSHFPTGYANGLIKDKYPQYRKLFLKLFELDFVGPLKDAQAMISYALEKETDKIVGVYMAKKIDLKTVDSSEIFDITSQVNKNQFVSFDLPEGEWKILVLVSTFEGGEEQTKEYLNPIVPEAVDILINEIYEAHYKKYKNEFGKTIAGFFSDEPRFGNMHGAYGSIGRWKMVLPWRDDMINLLMEAGDYQNETELKCKLPLLFLDGQEKAHIIRYQYMNLVSNLYAEHFSMRIGKWCQSHGVQYIGHTIEDNNAHARLGYGAGHFFRAMKGQDMAGIDVVLHQLLPGMDHHYNRSMTSSGWDGEFFHYVLGKLGSSLGHLDERKKGRAMCEVFGAYGWAEGNRLMKWIADYMLVRGINEFCPHAFNPKEYPDPDCPPHFFAHGHNPQYPEFHILMEYINRTAHLLSGGVHRAPVAVLYHGEAEWSGDYMLMQKPCALLTRNQIDFDIIPQEILVHAQIKENSFKVNQEQFKAIIIPYAEALPIACLEKLLEMSQMGVRVYFLESFPKRSSEGIKGDETINALKETAILSKLATLIEDLWREDLYEVKTTSYEPYLRYYHYEHEDGHVFMLVNEAPYKTIETGLKISLGKPDVRYDAFENTVYDLAEDEWENEMLHVKLAAYESVIYCWDSKMKTVCKNARKNKLVECLPIENPFQVSFAENGSNVFAETILLNKLLPIQKIEGKEFFSGTIRYKTTFSLEERRKTNIVLDTVYEGARVSVNGCEPKVRISPPYSFDVTEAVSEGENVLIIEVTTTLGRKRRDWLSQFLLVEPIGITNQVLVELS